MANWRVDDGCVFSFLGDSTSRKSGKNSCIPDLCHSALSWLLPHDFLLISQCFWNSILLIYIYITHTCMYVYVYICFHFERCGSSWEILLFSRPQKSPSEAWPWDPWHWVTWSDRSSSGSSARPGSFLGGKNPAVAGFFHWNLDILSLWNGIRWSMG